MSLLDRANVSRQLAEDDRGLLDAIQDVSKVKDLDTLLERVLQESRRFAAADAGTIYIVAGNYLYFLCVQNETLFNDERPVDKYNYTMARLPVNKQSLAGYVATTGDPLMIDDVYDINTDVTYSFNASFDRKTRYRTRSMLIVPLKMPDQGVVGVLQLINAMDSGGKVVPFSMRNLEVVSRFAESAALAIDKAREAREMILRMVDIAEMRDPYETTQHARRVAAYAVEIYQAWGLKHGMKQDEINRNKDALRTAAILHDVGKIAVSDTVLRKEGPLDYEEKMQVRFHTIWGARLFRHSSNPWDRAAEEVTLNHHEHWDGTGYPGHIDDIYADRVYFGRGKRGEEIPLFARIAALADVYDALISRRAYKPAWKEEHALKHIHVQAGKHFDPEIVDIFISIHDIISAIRRRFPIDRVWERMTIWVDSDGCPRKIREIIIRASLRTETPTVFVADRAIPVPHSPLLRVEIVAAGRNAADQFLIDSISSGDLAVTADIPLAASLIAAGVEAIHPRGDLLNAETVKERLGMRDFLQDLRDQGVDTTSRNTGNRRYRTGGPKEFAAALDRELTRRLDG